MGNVCGSCVVEPRGLRRIVSRVQGLLGSAVESDLSPCNTQTTSRRHVCQHCRILWRLFWARVIELDLKYSSKILVDWIFIHSPHLHRGSSLCNTVKGYNLCVSTSLCILALGINGVEWTASYISATLPQSQRERGDRTRIQIGLYLTELSRLVLVYLSYIWNYPRRGVNVLASVVANVVQVYK
jgi:hypothetical protein